MYQELMDHLDARLGDLQEKYGTFDSFCEGFEECMTMVEEFFEQHNQT